MAAKKKGGATKGPKKPTKTKGPKKPTVKKPSRKLGTTVTGNKRYGKKDK